MSETALALKRRKVIWPTEAARLLQIARADFGEFEYTLLALCYNMALRVSELVDLEFEDFHRGKSVVMIRTAKRGDDALDQLAVDVGVFRIVEEWAATEKRRTGYLFPGAVEGRPITTRFAEIVFERVALAAGIDLNPPPSAPDNARRRGIHGLRHGQAVNLVDAGASRAVVAAQLRHGDIRSVDWYFDTALELAVRAKAGTAVAPKPKGGKRGKA